MTRQDWKDLLEQLDEQARELRRESQRLDVLAESFTRKGAKIYRYLHPNYVPERDCNWRR
jgi:hypothetical protein